MKTYEIVISTTSLYVTSKKFANEEEASIWADEQAGVVCPEAEADWSFSDSTSDVEWVTEKEMENE